MHPPDPGSLFEKDVTHNSAMIGLLYITATLKRYEYFASQEISSGQQDEHQRAMNCLQQARRNQSDAIDRDRLAEARAAALENSAAYLAKIAADKAVEIMKANADNALRLRLDAQQDVLNTKRLADNAAAALLNARVQHLNALTVLELERQKVVADQRRSDALKHEEVMRLQQKKLADELEVLRIRSSHAANAARLEGERLQRAAAQAAKVAHEAWLLTPDGIAHLLVEAQKVIRERSRREEAARRIERLHWEQTERIRQYGDERPLPFIAWMFCMLILLVISGTVDLYLIWQLRPGADFSISKLFGALAGTAIAAEAFWSLWMWCFTAAHWSSGKPWYGEQGSSTGNFFYMLGCWILFVGCSTPGLSTYVILGLFYWDTFVGSCAGNTCPALVPGFSSYDLVIAKLLVQGILRVIPCLAVAAITLTAATCPFQCSPDFRCVLDELVLSQFNLTDCFRHTDAGSAAYNGCDQTCFLDTRNRTSAIISLVCAGSVILSMLIYALIRYCSPYSGGFHPDQVTDIRMQTFEEYKIAMVRFHHMRPTQQEMYNSPMYGGR